jgi:hypothetical protein
MSARAHTLTNSGGTGFRSTISVPVIPAGVSQAFDRQAQIIGLRLQLAGDADDAAIAR